MRWCLRACRVRVLEIHACTALCIGVALGERERAARVSEQRDHRRLATDFDDGTVPSWLSDTGLRRMFGDDADVCLADDDDLMPSDEELEALDDNVMNEIREGDEATTAGLPASNH